MSDERPLLIGLTGPIGCGKSTVARMLGELGGSVIDADDLARRATSPGSSTLGDIRARFGASVFDAHGELDRAALSAAAFADDGALAALEGIVHPEVRRLVEERLAQAALENVPFVALEAIKLVEGGLAERCDHVWLIDCRPDAQFRRSVERGGDPADLERRRAAQGPDLVKRLAAALGDRAGVRVLSTDDSLDETRERVEEALADALEPLLD